MQFVEEMLKQAKNDNNSNKTPSGPIDIAEINNVFKMPIQYNDKTRKLNENIIADLELVKTIEQGEGEGQKEGSKEIPIYNHIFKSSNIYSNLSPKTKQISIVPNANFAKN